MNDREAYLLNGIVQRDFRVGRIIRFREITSGIQSKAIEILASNLQLYVVLIYPQTFPRKQLNMGAEKSTCLTRATFPSLQFIERVSADGWVVDGPQGSHLMVAKFPAGQIVPYEQWNAQDLSQLGVRLAWMHRMATDADRERVSSPLYTKVAHLLREPSPRRNALLNLLDAATLQTFVDAQKGKPSPQGWIHGGINQSSVLMDNDRQIAALIDWGLTGSGDSYEDAVDVFVRWCVDTEGQIRATEARAFLEAFMSLDPEPQTLDWQEVVNYWCMRQIHNALLDYCPLPRGFLSILRNPAFLSTAIALCQNRNH